MTRVALLIGVSNYGPGLQSLPGTPRDVEAMQRVLEAPELGGFQVQKLLDPDPLVMQEAMEVMLTNCQPEDLALLFFSGHSLKDEQGALYLGTSITRKNSQGHLVKSTAVSARLMREFLHSCPAQQQVVILDCCFSGAFAEILVPLTPPEQAGLQERVLMASSTALQYSLSSMQLPYQQLGLDLSTFTHYLTEGIETGAANPNGKGRLSILELYEYTQRRVQIAAPGMQPQLYASEAGKHIPLVRAAAKGTELTYQREIESWISGSNITPIGRSALAVQQQNLSLSVETAVRLEALVLRPYREYSQRLQRYEQMLLEAIQREHPLSEENQVRLRRLRQVLGLTEEGVSLITLQLEEYGRCLQRYEQALIEIVKESYPPNAYAQQELQQLQRVLGLSDRDVATLTARIEEYHRRRQRYEQALVETVQQQYPLSEESCQQLKRLQHILQLTSEDITPIIARVETYRKRLLQYEQELTESVPWQHLFPVESVNELAQAQPFTVPLGEGKRSPTIPPTQVTPPPDPAPPEPASDPEAAPQVEVSVKSAAPELPETDLLPSPAPGESAPDTRMESTNPALKTSPWDNPPLQSSLLQTSWGFSTSPTSTYLGYQPPTPPGQNPLVSNASPFQRQNPLLASVALGVMVGVLIGAVGCLIVINLPSPAPAPAPVPSPRSPSTVGTQ